jgi:tetratricopeptide (TPR) repeat protein
MVRNQLNVRLLFRVLMTLVVSATVVHLLHGWQMQRYARTASDDAERAESEGRLDQAATSWHRCRAFAPEDPRVMFRYALTLRRMTDSPRARAQALSLLRQVVAQQPTWNDARRCLADLALELGYPAEADRQLENLLPSSDDPAELETLLGQCAERENDAERASQWYNRAMRHAPSRIEPAARQAALWQSLGRPARAVAVMDALVKANPKSSTAYLARARYHLGAGNLDKAEADLDRVDGWSRDDAGALATRAELELRRGQMDRARKLWQEGIAAHPDDATLVLGLARMESRLGRNDEALACLRRAVEHGPVAPEVVAALVEELLRRHQWEEAATLLGVLKRVNPSAPRLRYLEGCELYHRGHAIEASRLLAEVAAIDPPGELTVQALLLLAKCHEQTGAVDRQITTLGRAVELAPSLPEARQALGMVYLDQERPDDAVEQFRQLLNLPQPAPESATLLARALLGRAVQAPNRSAVWPDFERALARAETVPGQGVTVELLRAEAAFASGQTGEALAALAELRRRHADVVAVWTTSVQLTGFTGDLATAYDLLRQAREKLGDRIEVRLAGCGTWLPEKAGRKTEQMLTELEHGLSRYSPADQGRLLRHLAEARSRLGEDAHAIHLARRAVDVQPDDVRGSYVLLEVSLPTAFTEGVESALAALRRLEGEDGTFWRYGQAAWLVRQARREDAARLREARELLDDVAERRPGWTRPLLLQGLLSEREGHLDAALGDFLQAVDLGERRPIVLLQIIQRLEGRGRLAEADRLFRLLPLSLHLSADQLRLAATAALAAKNLDRAVELARGVVAPNATEVADHLWLGNLLASAGRITEAEEAFWAAIRTAPMAPEPWLAMVSHLVRINEPERAAPLLEEIGRKLSPAQAALTLAACHEMMAQFDQAETQYQKALQRRPTDATVLSRAAAFEVRLGRVAAAEPLFRTLLATNPPDNFATWARRQLALCLAERGDAAALTEAAALLQKNPAPDPRACALLAAVQPEKRREALRELERLPAGPLPPAEERYLLARLYGKEGDWAKVELLYRGLLDQDANNPAYLSGFIEALLKRRKLGETRTVLAHLTRIEPDAPRTRELQSRVEAASKPVRPRK